MIRTVFFPHVAAAILVSGIILLVYTSVQQQYRTGANDPQIQIARDAAAKLRQGKPIAQVMQPDTVDMEQSLSSSIQLYSPANKLIASTGYIGTMPPVAPEGVFEKARQDGEYMVTWQPTAMARMAAVVVYTGGRNGNYILVARQLAEVEKREAALVKMCFMCWIACMLVISAHGLLQAYLNRKTFN